MESVVRRGILSILLGVMLFNCYVIKAAPAQTSSKPEIKVTLDEVRNGSPQQIFGHEILQTPPESSSRLLAAYIAKKNGEYKKQFLVIQSAASQERIYSLSYPPGYGGLDSLKIMGSKAFFAFGYPPVEPYGTYQIYVLDLQNQQLNRADADNSKLQRRGISYMEWEASPDGQYTTYVTGGDANGMAEFALFNETMYTGPRELRVFDWQKQQEQIVISDDAVRGPFAWLPPHTLLYTAVPWQEQQIAEAVKQEELKLAQEKAAKKAEKDIFFDRRRFIGSPCIWAYSPVTGQKRLLIGDAHTPLPSPDGKWIAFYSSKALCVVDSNGKRNRRALDTPAPDAQSPPLVRPAQLQWSPDGKHLYAMSTSAQADSLNVRAEIRQWDIMTGRFHVIADLSAKMLNPVSAEAPRFEIAPEAKADTPQKIQFLQRRIEEDHKKLDELRPYLQFKSVSTDGRLLYVVLYYQVQRQYQESLTWPIYRKHFYAIDISTGQATEIARENESDTWSLGSMQLLAQPK